MTNNITRYLNKIVLTFTKDNEEAYQYPDEIVTKSGKSFPTLQKLIKYYTKEERDSKEREKCDEREKYEDNSHDSHSRNKKQ